MFLFGRWLPPQDAPVVPLSLSGHCIQPQELVEGERKQRSHIERIALYFLARAIGENISHGSLGARDAGNEVPGWKGMVTTLHDGLQ